MLYSSEPLIMTHKSHTVLKSYNRYVDTVYYTHGWYTKKPWESKAGLKVLVVITRKRACF